VGVFPDSLGIFGLAVGNFNQAQPLDKVHVSGGAWEKRIGRREWPDGHQAENP
jgi:hypothetical protein